TDSTVPTSVSSARPASRPSIRLLRMLVISSGLICMALLRSRLGDVPAQLLQSGFDRGVEDRIADAHDDSADDVRVDVRGQRDRAPGALADRPAETLGGRRVQLDRARDLDGKRPVLLFPQAIELRAHAEDRG